MVKQLQSGVGLLTSGAALLIAAQSVSAQPTTQVTGVRLKATQDGLNLVLETSTGARPQIFTTSRGKDLVADIINTHLSLSEGKSFHQDNPAPGIASVLITQLDPNSIRMVVTGTNGAPRSQPAQREAKGITLSISPTTGTATVSQVPTRTNPSAQTPVNPTPTPSPQSGTDVTPTPTPSPQLGNDVSPTPTPSSQTQPNGTPTPLTTPPGKKPDVLVPNPNITIDGKPAPAAGVAQPISPAPPFLPRAIAPPVGDIAVSSTDTSPSAIDLGTNERVPRLVLRDAPVREVLSLLARAAGLNLAYSATGTTGAPSPAGGTAAEGPTISLDIENEPVQDVFNYVLRLSGLDANRSGRTIFVGTKLPNSARNVIARSLRLNQVTVGVALNFLVGLGAESAVSRERLVTTVNAVPVGTGQTAVTQTQTATETQLQTQRIRFQDSEQVLIGLEALGDERTNSITLVGTPRQVDIATAQIIQLDARRRQVAINVKIVDVNLLASENFTTSFSFGVGDSFFSNDAGNGTANFGGTAPPTATNVRSSITSTPTISNPYSGNTPFVNPNQPITIQGASPGTTIINNTGTNQTFNGQTIQPGVTFLPSNSNSQTTTFQPLSPASQNPLSPGFTNISQPTNNIVTISGTAGNITQTVTQGTQGTVTTALPSLFQYPQRFLAQLQAQVTTGNAKILTDPTLIVQEGQTANVNLTQQVVGNVTNQIVRDNGGSTQTVTAAKENVGLTLNIRIERIDDNGFVSLSVAPVVRAPVSSQIINLGNGSSQQIFLVNERSLNSGLIRLRDSQTLILSGIIQDQDRTTISKIPILGDIPILGALFRSTSRTNQRQEVIVLLTPQIIDDSERSSFGYNYTPTPEVRELLERRGLKLPKNKPQ